ncbi:MAG: CHASE3 domain-containing protein, partial [Planctomycetia bacterium]|nr:CHASE3 domain-containing protein [Planctomycetia bacterium]
MKGHRFEKKIASQFGAVTALLALVAAAAYYSAAVASSNARRVEQTHEMLRALDRVLALILSAETGQRGYLLTGRDAYLEPFDAAAGELDHQLEDLGTLLRDEPGGPAGLASLRGRIAAKFAELRQTTDDRRRAGLGAALPAVMTDRGKRLMDEIRGRVGALRGDQVMKLRRLKARADGDARSALIVSATGVALTLAILGFAFRLIVHELAARERAEAGLSRLAAIIASSDDPVIGMSLTGTINCWNAAAERLLGYPAAESVGRHFAAFLAEERRPRAGAVLARVVRGEDVGQEESVGLRKDGTMVDVELRISPIRDPSGTVVGASTIARDVTARKRAEALLRERTDALEVARARLAAAAGFASALNQPGMLETYRETLTCLARVAGAPLAVLYDVVEGEPPRALCAVGPDLLPLESAALKGDGLPASVARDGEPRELLGPFPDDALRTRFGLGEVPLHSILGWPVSFRGRTLGVLVTAHTAPTDGERQTFIAAALEQLAVRMDGYQVDQQRLRLLADLRGQSRALEAARLESERANRAKSEFLAAMSHELRTPMNSIMGFTARLLRKLGPTLGERELDALQTVDRNARHLLGLINDILDLSKIEAGKTDARPEPFDLAALAREAAGQSAPLLDGKPVELVLDLPGDPVVVEADPKLVKQVVLNLLSNAAKFTDRGTVTVTAASVRDGSIGDAVRLSVRDTGIGIEPGDRGKLFQRFSQIDGSPGRRAGGTGLGLALSEGMVRLQHGRIDVTSEPGVG